MERGTSVLLFGGFWFIEVWRGCFDGGHAFDLLDGLLFYVDVFKFLEFLHGGPDGPRYDANHIGSNFLIPQIE